MHSLENNIQDHLHESGCSGELDKAATKSAERFDTKDLANKVQYNGEFFVSSVFTVR